MVNGQERDRKIIVVKGDIDGDGRISNTDLNLVLNHVSGISLISDPSPFFEATDIDSDGEITMIDYSRVLYHVSDISYIHPQP